MAIVRTADNPKKWQGTACDYWSLRTRKCCAAATCKRHIACTYKATGMRMEAYAMSGDSSKPFEQGSAGTDKTRLIARSNAEKNVALEDRYRTELS